MQASKAAKEFVQRATEHQRDRLLLGLIRHQRAVCLAEHRAYFRPRHFQVSSVQDDDFGLGRHLQLDGHCAGKFHPARITAEVDVVGERSNVSR